MGEQDPPGSCPGSSFLQLSLLQTLKVPLPPLFLGPKVGSPFSSEVAFATPWTVAYQAPPSMEFSRQKYWSALPFPSPGDLPNSEIKPRCPALQAGALPSEPPGRP